MGRGKTSVQNGGRGLVPPSVRFGVPLFCPLAVPFGVLRFGLVSVP